MAGTTLSRRSHLLLAVLLVLAAASLALSRHERAFALTYTVNITSDPAPDGLCDATDCSLREAIIAANANPNVDTIDFDLPGGSVHILLPDSPLPAISESVTITGICGTCDGASLNTAAAWQPSDLALKVMISGANVAAADTPGLRITGGAVIIRGLIITSWTGPGIQVDNNESVAIEGNIIGTNAAMTSALPNQRGIEFNGGGNSNVGSTFAAGRNVISGNTGDGIRACAAGADGIVIEGNFIGVNGSGTAAIPNGSGIVLCTADNFSVGDGVAGAGNLVSGNTGDGIRVSSSVAPFIQGNRVGTSADGLSALPNGGAGIALVSTPSALVGGSTVADGNLASGNTGTGVSVSNSDFPTVWSNTIGLNLTRTAALPNATGVSLLNTTDSTVQANWISGNSANGLNITNGSDISVINNRLGRPDGVTMVGNGSAGVLVQGTATRVDIGVGPSDGNNILGNGSNGLSISGSTSVISVEDNLISENTLAGILVSGGTGINIGSLDSDEVNTVENNGTDGIAVTGATAKAQILGNFIIGNGSTFSDLGIDLNPNGVTNNDPLDADAGPNDLQNTPQILEAFSNGTEAFVRVRLESKPNSQYTIEIFAANSICTPGRPNATVLLARRISALTGVDGVFEGEIDLPNGTGSGFAVTSTATDQATLVTSELSPLCTFIEPAVFIDTPGAPASFQPANRVVNIDTEVAFVNRHNTTHTATSDLDALGPATGKYFDSGLLPAGDVFRFTFDSAGVFSYFCQVHPNMQGTITVNGLNDAAEPTSLLPDRAFLSTGPVNVAINGSAFTSQTTVGFFDGAVQVGADLQVLARSENQMTVVVTNTQLATPGTFSIQPSNPAPGGGGGTVDFRVIRWPTDVQCDLDLDADDALAIMRKLAGFTAGILPQDCDMDPIVPNADVNRDGSETLADVIFARQRIAGLIKDIE